MLLISNPFVKAFLKKKFLVSSLYNQVTEVCQMAFNTPMNLQKKPHKTNTKSSAHGLQKPVSASKSEAFFLQRTAVTYLSDGEPQLLSIPDQVPLNC